MEDSRKKMEESLANMNNGDVSDTSSEHDTADIPTIVVDPVDDGREVSVSYFIRHLYMLI